MRTQLRIGEVAQLVGITPKTIRHYEKLGLLASPERSAGDYRLYGASEIVRLVHIRRLQSLGLSLARIRELLAAESSGDIDIPAAVPVLLQRVADQIALPDYGPGSATWEQDARIFGMLETLQLPRDVSAEMQVAIDQALQSPQHKSSGCAGWASGSPRWLTEPTMRRRWSSWPRRSGPSHGHASYCGPRPRMERGGPAHSKRSSAM